MKQGTLQTSWARRRPAILSRLQSLGQPMSVLWTRHQLGLVLTEKTVEFSLVRRRPGGHEVVDFQAVEPEGYARATWPVRLKLAVDTIHHYLRQQRLSRLSVNVALLGHDIGFRRLNLPAMPDNELDAAVIWEGKRLFPFDLDACVVHHEIVRKFEAGSGSFVAVNIIAARQDIIDLLYGQFQSAGLTLGQVTFLPCFLARLAGEKSRDKSQASYLVLYLHERNTLAIIVRDGVLEFCQEFATQPIMGLVGTSAIDNTAALAEELNSCLDLYHAQQRESTVRAIIVCGKSGDDDKVIADLSEMTTIPCRSLGEIRGLFSNRDTTQETTAGSGVAPIITALAPSHIHPLAPSLFHRRHQKQVLHRRLAAAVCLAVMFAAIWHYSVFLLEQSLSSRLEKVQAEIAAIESSPAYHAMLLLGASEEAHNRRTGSLTRDSRYEALLKELSLISPESLTLSSCAMQEEEGRRVLRLDGNIQLAGFAPEIILARYVQTLEESPFFGGVTVVSHQKQRGESGFTLTFQLQMDVGV